MKRLCALFLLLALCASNDAFALGGTSGTGSGTSLTPGSGGASVSVTAGSSNIVINPSPGTGTFTVDTSASPAFATSVTTPLLIGGSGTTQTLTYKTTTGVGAAGADHIFQVGNNGATEAMRILNSGFVGVGTNKPLTQFQIRTGTDMNLYFAPKVNLATGVAISIANDANSANASLEIIAGSSNTVFLNVGKVAVSSGASGGTNVNLAVNGGAAFGTYGAGTTGLSQGLIVSGSVGIGTASVASAKAAINGSIAAGTYAAANNAPPSNGLIISGNVGIGTATAEQPLSVQGTIRQTTELSCATGLTTDASGAINGCVASDRTLKTDISGLSYDPKLIGKLKPVSYKWKDIKIYDVDAHAGFIAQDVRKIFPQAIKAAGKNLIGIDPNALNAAIVLELQHQRIEIDALKNKLH